MTVDEKEAERAELSRVARSLEGFNTSQYHHWQLHFNMSFNKDKTHQFLFKKR
jgi:hypothetical protein